MTHIELLSLAAALFGIVFSPLGAWFAYRSYKKSTQAVEGANELSRRLTSRALYKPDGQVKMGIE